MHCGQIINMKICKLCFIESNNFSINRNICKDCRRIRDSNNRKLNPERYRENNRKSYYKYKIYKTEFKKNDKEWQRLRNIQKRIKRLKLLNKVINELTKEQWEDIMYLYNYKCVYCHLSNGNTIDHIIPLSKLGDHAYWNVVPCCKKCNSKKGNR